MQYINPVLRKLFEMMVEATENQTGDVRSRVQKFPVWPTF